MLPTVLTKEVASHPLTFLLIGASGGLPEHWRPYDNLLNIIGFEPDPNSYRNLPQLDNQHYINIGLLDHRDSVTLYQTKNPAVSSIYKPNQDFLDRFAVADYFHLTGQSEVKVDTLDNLNQEGLVTSGDFLQLDTQGSELLILQGGNIFLQKYGFGVEVEIEFAPLYQKQPLFPQVDEYLQSLGFYLFDIRPQYFKRKIGLNYGNRKGQLLAGDALYLRNMTSYFHLLNNWPPDQQKLKIYYAVLICLHYGYLDYALELTNNSDGWLSDDEIGRLTNSIKAIRSTERILPDFPGRGRLSKYFQTIADWLRAPNSRGRLRGTLGNVKIDH
ncbi:MAG: FkbM family methyltransferase [Patescibacteria group bacterium]|jgi:FkbM family methyltransferase